MRRVVVTGVGLVTPLGLDVESTWAGLVEGRSGVGRITRFDPAAHASQIAGEVRGFDPERSVERREARRMDRFTLYAIAAARQAAEAAGLDPADGCAERTGVLVGSAFGGLETLANGVQTLLEKGPGRISPFLSTMLLANMAAGQVAIHLGLRGPSFAAVSACASGANAIGEAYETIRRGGADAMLAGGSEAPICPIGVAQFDAMRALSTRNEAPAAASRPFDIDRDGFVIAEGAGMLVLEERGRARARGAPALAEVVGYGATADAHHVSAPPDSGEGAARAMREALAAGQVAPEEVGYLNAHATSTDQGDVAEAAAIRAVFGGQAGRVAVSATKSATGHLLGAAGAVETIVCVLALARGCLPPTLNLERPDPRCDLDHVVGRARPTRTGVAVNNSFGFGGQNATLVLRAAA